MEDRKRWEMCQKEYECKLKSVEEKLYDQRTSATTHLQNLQKESARSRELMQQMKSAFTKMSDIEANVQIKSQQVNYLKQRCQELDRSGKSLREKCKDNTVIIAELRGKLKDSQLTVENLQKDSLELKKLKDKLSTVRKKTQTLEGKVIKLERERSELQSKLKFEVQNRERLGTVISRLTDENSQHRKERQRLHFVECELETAQGKIKQHDEYDKKMQELKSENIGLRKTNAVLIKKLELRERCDNKVKIEFERQEIKPTTSPPASNLNHTSSVVLPNPNSFEFPTSCGKLRAVEKQKAGTANSSNISSRSELSLSSGMEDFGHQTMNRRVTRDDSCIKSFTEPTNRKSPSFETPSVTHVHERPISAASTQLCETDVLFLKSLREMLSRHTVSPPKVKAAKTKPVGRRRHAGSASKDIRTQLKPFKSRKQNKSDLIYSQPSKIRCRSNSNLVKSRDTGKVRKVKKVRLNPPNAHMSRVKKLRKTN